MSDLFDRMRALKAQMDALPPPPLAVRLHPADAATVQRATDRKLTPQEEMGALQLFVSLKAQRGKFDTAYDRATIQQWRDEEMEG